MTSFNRHALFYVTVYVLKPNIRIRILIFIELEHGSKVKEFEDKNRCFEAVNSFSYLNIELLYFKCRVSKEKTSYEREVVANENKLEKMKQEGKDEYEIKKQVIRNTS